MHGARGFSFLTSCAHRFILISVQTRWVLRDGEIAILIYIFTYITDIAISVNQFWILVVNQNSFSVTGSAHIYQHCITQIISLTRYKINDKLMWINRNYYVSQLLSTPLTCFFACRDRQINILWWRIFLRHKINNISGFNGLQPVVRRLLFTDVCVDAVQRGAACIECAVPINTLAYKTHETLVVLRHCVHE